MRSKYLQIFLLLSTTYLTAQTDSTPIGRVVYIHQVDLPSQVHYYGYSSLLFNVSKSIYIHNSVPARDSNFINTESDLTMSISGDQEGFPIYKNHNTGVMSCKISCRQSKKHCIVSDTFDTASWTIHPEDHRTFVQYDCQRASCHFRGREYNVWYTLDIPVSSGPFKFCGLPGLILEAVSTDGKVKFLFDRLEISEHVAGTVQLPSGKNINMSYKEYMLDLSKFSDNLVREMKSKGVEMTISQMEEIELNLD